MSDSADLPFGSGQFSVWGVPATEREQNTGLRASAQDATRQEVEIYRTDDEEEARRLVREGGFERQGQFYATTRMANSTAAAHKEAVESASGVLKRDDPKFHRSA